MMSLPIWSLPHRMLKSQYQDIINFNVGRHIENEKKFLKIFSNVSVLTNHKNLKNLKWQSLMQFNIFKFMNVHDKVASERSSCGNCHVKMKDEKLVQMQKIS